MRRALLPWLAASLILVLAMAGSAAAKPADPVSTSATMGTVLQVQETATGDVYRNFYFMASGTLESAYGYLLYVSGSSSGGDLDYHVFDVVKYYKNDAKRAAMVGVLKSTTEQYYVDQGYIGHAWMTLWVQDRGHKVQWAPSFIGSVAKELSSASTDELAWRWQFEVFATPASEIPPDEWLTDWVVPYDDGPGAPLLAPVRFGNIAVY